MDNTYKIRVHLGRMETKYGVDVANIFDDPVTPMYSEDEVIEKLMSKLNYIPNYDEDASYPGLFDDSVGAYFDYDGYIDIDIPNSIIERVKNDK